MLLFFKDSFFFLAIAQKNNTTLIRLQNVYTYSLKCKQVEEKLYNLRTFSHPQTICLLNKILISCLHKLFTVHTSPMKFF